MPSHPTTRLRSSEGSTSSPSTDDHTSLASATQYGDVMLTRLATIEERELERDVRDKEKQRQAEARDAEIQHWIEAAAARTREEMTEQFKRHLSTVDLATFTQPCTQRCRWSWTKFVARLQLRLLVRSHRLKAICVWTDDRRLGLETITPFRQNWLRLGRSREAYRGQ